MKSTNQLTRFLAMIFFIALFFLLAGISKLVAQDTSLQNPAKTKYPLGYSLTFSFDPQVDNKAYILSPGTGFKSSHKVDSFYVKLIDFSYKENLKEDALIYMLTHTYLASNGDEVFAYSDSTEVRNQENWPQVDKVIFRYYGKLVEDTISIRKETTQEYLRKGLAGPIISFCYMGIFLVLLVLFHMFIIKNWEDLDGGYYFALFILFGAMSLPWVFKTDSLIMDNFGFWLYFWIWLGIFTLTILTIIIYSIALEKHKKELGLL